MDAEDHFGQDFRQQVCRGATEERTLDTELAVGAHLHFVDGCPRLLRETERRLGCVAVRVERDLLGRAVHRQRPVLLFRWQVLGKQSESAGSRLDGNTHASCKVHPLQRLERETLQVLTRPVDHPRRDFLGADFKQEIAHAVTSASPSRCSTHAFATATAKPRTR